MCLLDSFNVCEISLHTKILCLELFSRLISTYNIHVKQLSFPFQLFFWLDEEVVAQYFSLFQFILFLHRQEFKLLQRKTPSKFWFLSKTTSCVRSSCSFRKKNICYKNANTGFYPRWTVLFTWFNFFRDKNINYYDAKTLSHF